MKSFLLSIALYSAGRLFLDAYRDNAWLTADGYHIVQMIALAALVVLMRMETAVAPENNLT